MSNPYLRLRNLWKPPVLVLWAVLIGGAIVVARNWEKITPYLPDWLAG